MHPNAVLLRRRDRRSTLVRRAPRRPAHRHATAASPRSAPASLAEPGETRRRLRGPPRSSPAASTCTPTCTSPSAQVRVSDDFATGTGRGRDRRHDHDRRLRHRLPGRGPARRARDLAALGRARVRRLRPAHDVHRAGAGARRSPRASRRGSRRSSSTWPTRSCLQVDDDVIFDIMRRAQSTAASSRCTARTAARSRRCAGGPLAEGRTGVHRARPHPAGGARGRGGRARGRARRGRGHERVRRARVVGTRARRGPHGARARRRRDRRDVPAVPLPRHRVASPAPTASRSCARRRCATPGTSRSCGTGSPPARCTPSRPTTARSPSPTGGPGTRAPADGLRRLHRDPGRPPRHRDPPGARLGGRARPGRITRADWVRLCAEAPARTFGLWPAKGTLRVGADADVVVWDPSGAQSLDAAALHMDVDHSPYAGHDGHRLARARAVARRRRRARRALRRRAGTRPLRQSRAPRTFAVVACVTVSPRRSGSCRS